MTLTSKDPVEIGQYVKVPDLKQWTPVLETKPDSMQVRLKTFGWRDVTLWDRRENTADDIKSLMIEFAQKEDVIADYARNQTKLDQENDDLRGHNNRLTRSTERMTGEKERREKAETDTAKFQLQIGNMEMKHKEEIDSLNAQLGKMRNQALKTETDEALLITRNKEIGRLREDSKRFYQNWKQEESRADWMLTPDNRVAHQETPVQFFTMSDNVDSTPADVKIAKHLSDGWQIISQSFVPSDSGTIRYLSFTRHAPLPPLDEDADQTSVELAQSMDDAINRALATENIGEHIATLTAPIEAIADTGFAVGESQS